MSKVLPEAGTRARRLEEQRAKARAEFERAKADVERQSEAGVGGIAQRFATKSDWAEEKLKAQTVGLVSLDEFQQRRAEIEAEAALFKKQAEASEGAKRRKKRKRNVDVAKLSFAGDEDEAEGGEADDAPAPDEAEREGAKRRKFGKDPTVDTSFLPDHEREEFERAERLRLAREYIEEQERIKNTEIEVTFSYYDGTSHRRTMEVTQGTRIGQFLGKVRELFKELRAVSVENLMFIKEDVIIPHQYSFYDLIVTKARGKSGPLFNWDVHEDVRLLHDARKEKDESHAAKVVERHWYERNKHIFPASRWEIFDPTVKRGKYTLKGD